jgi:WhiB family transcriptional regulator, redox-sensing transcriptional regulator
MTTSTTSSTPERHGRTDDQNDLLDPPPLSTTTEREHVVFTARTVLEREHLAPVTPVPSVSTCLFDPADEFLLGQPRHVADQLPCRVQDPDLWFAETPGELEQAKAFCAGCPALQACLSGALGRREPWGVWGGEIFDHGVVIARKRPRGRPRKDEVAA